MKPRRRDMHPIDGLLRQVFDTPDPSEVDLARADQAFRARITGQDRSPVPRGKWRLPRLAAASMVAVALVVALVGIQVTRPSSAATAIAEVAEAARLVDPFSIDEQSYAYRRSVSLDLVVTPLELVGRSGGDFAYLVPRNTELWAGADGAELHRTETGTPRFFEADIEVLYYEFGIDELDGVGETRMESFVGAESKLAERDWPTDPDDLNTLLNTLAPESDRRIQLALALIREPAASPELRAAALEAIGRIEGLVLAEKGADQVTFEMEFAFGEDRTLYRFTLSTDGALLSESEALTNASEVLGIPAGAVISQTTYDPLVIIDEVPECADCG